MTKEINSKITKNSKKPSKSITVKRDPIESSTVILVKGKGSSERGGLGGYYWHIYTDNKRVGYVFINMINDEFFNEHPSIQIHVNQSERGQQIGRVAYRLACEASGYHTVYAHMRKNNHASRRAAEEAGFRKVENDLIPQLAMVWQPSKENI